LESNSDEITSRSRGVLRALLKRSKPVRVSTVQVKQEELAKELSITRQALNIHLKKLREKGFIRTGRGFIDITESGLSFLGRLSQPQFVFTKVSPQKRKNAYQEITKLPTRSIHRVTGDMDLVIIVDREKLDDVLKAISSIDGIEETKSYVTIEALK
jgi:DNA-binding Lrp family transcriptional regulator